MIKNYNIELDYDHLLNFIRGHRNYVSNYRKITKNFPKIKFIKNSRHKKCRGYYRKLYKSLIPVYDMYINCIYGFFKFMDLEIADRTEKDNFLNKFINPFSDKVLDIVLDLAHRQVNNELRLTTYCPRQSINVNSDYRTIKYKLIINKRYMEYIYNWNSLNIELIESESIWREIKLILEY